MPLEPNYLRKIRELIAAGILPADISVNRLGIYHDEWCAIYQSPEAVCNCDSDISYPAVPHVPIS